jgi:hypothetical protein
MSFVSKGLSVVGWCSVYVAAATRDGNAVVPKEGDGDIEGSFTLLPSVPEFPILKESFNPSEDLFMLISMMVCFRESFSVFKLLTSFFKFIIN